MDDEMAAHCIETPPRIQAIAFSFSSELEKAGRMSAGCRDERRGVKLNDADLISCHCQGVISEMNLSQRMIELSSAAPTPSQNWPQLKLRLV
ncbi:MAG: hypothetical protein AUF79_19160 [Crenarchaeota archaeon 13_1_20CM_2_51_8]|nr:MAG: hypothetical protein AUF79_19160 [Crenarchaeota archaeon 13_1_20CM_2_51_8]